MEFYPSIEPFPLRAADGQALTVARYVVFDQETRAQVYYLSLSLEKCLAYVPRKWFACTNKTLNYLLAMRYNDLPTGSFIITDMYALYLGDITVEEDEFIKFYEQVCAGANKEADAAFLLMRSRYEDKK